MFNKLQDLTGLAAVGRKQPGPHWWLDLPTLAQPWPADTADTAVSSMAGEIPWNLVPQSIPGVPCYRWQFPSTFDDQRCKQQMLFTNPRDQNRGQFPLHHRQTTSTCKMCSGASTSSTGLLSHYRRCQDLPSGYWGRQPGSLLEPPGFQRDLDGMTSPTKIRVVHKNTTLPQEIGFRSGNDQTLKLFLKQIGPDLIPSKDYLFKLRWDHPTTPHSLFGLGLKRSLGLDSIPCWSHGKNLHIMQLVLVGTDTYIYILYYIILYIHIRIYTHVYYSLIIGECKRICW